MLFKITDHLKVVYKANNWTVVMRPAVGHDKDGNPTGEPGTWVNKSYHGDSLGSALMRAWRTLLEMDDSAYDVRGSHGLQRFTGALLTAEAQIRGAISVAHHENRAPPGS